jgi:hypothetical protein
LYAYYYYHLKEIALKYGYNLVLHGSMQRDLDLIAIPWACEIKPYKEMLEEFASSLGGYVLQESEDDHKAFRVKYHGRECYIINLNRGRDKDGKDLQYYLDISIIPALREKIL